MKTYIITKNFMNKFADYNQKILNLYFFKQKDL